VAKARTERFWLASAPASREVFPRATILKVSGIEVFLLGFQNVLGDVQHLFRQSHGRDVREILRLAAHLVLVAQRNAAQTRAHRLDENGALAVGEHHPPHAHQTLRGHRLANDRKRLQPTWSRGAM